MYFVHRTILEYFWCRIKMDTQPVKDKKKIKVE